jgi:SAM-dependent methyltransferase
MTLTATGPNAEQIRFWNEVNAAKWIRFQRAIDEQIGSLGRIAMDKAEVRVGERVLDVGCGCGDTTLELARRVAPSGFVVGLDVSAPMLGEAERRARERGVSNASFRNSDAQTHAFSDAEFDVAYSRFGVMFFADPVRAFANLREALHPGGRLAFVCWQALDRNPWMAVPMAAAAREIPFPPPSDPHAPGPFAFSDPQRVRRILTDAGFANVVVEGHDEILSIGGRGGVDAAAEFLVQMGPTGSALRQAGPSAESRVQAAVREALAPFSGPGGVEMTSATWIILAFRPLE